jgi:hypothetical protein
LCFWSAKKLGRPTDFWSFRELKEGIEQRDVDKWYKGYLRMNYITHGHVQCASARHTVALETYVILANCEAMIW